MLPGGRGQQAQRLVEVQAPEALGFVHRHPATTEHRVYVGVALCAASHEDVGARGLAGG